MLAPTHGIRPRFWIDCPLCMRRFGDVIGVQRKRVRIDKSAKIGTTVHVMEGGFRHAG